MSDETDKKSAGPTGDSVGDRLELLLDCVVERYQRGERPSLSQFMEKDPELAERIRRVFPALVLLGQVQKEKSAGRGGAMAPTGEGTGEAAAEGRVEGKLPALGEYRLIRELGRGGMGVVYEAEQESLGRRVALKILPFHSLMDPRRIERFEREARAAASLQHPNIVPVHGMGVHEGVHYYAMQYVEGQSLDRVLPELKRSGGTGSAGIPVADFGRPRSSDYYHSIARMIRQAAEALAYAHGKGIFHRDIKPANLIVDSAGRTWIADFGLAKAADSESLTRTGEIVGTLRYMAPEQLRGRSDHRSDIYSLGLTLYELVTLEPAFPEGDREKLRKSVSADSPPPPRQLDRRVPRGLERIVLKAIQREPEARYQSAAEMAQDLERFLGAHPVRARLPGRGHLLKHSLKRQRATWIVAVLLVAAVSAGIPLWRGVHRPKGVESLIAGDMDGDGDNDLVTVNTLSNSVSILMNDGKGVFSVGGHFEVARKPFSAAAADMDGDGDFDLAVSSLESGSLTLLQNLGNGFYERAPSLMIGEPTLYVAAGDLDGDGDMDLAMTAPLNYVHLLKNVGNLEFVGAPSLETSRVACNLILADLDHDGDQDLVTTDNLTEAPTKNLSVFLNQGVGTFAAPVDFDLGKPARGITAADLNGDGDLDLAVVAVGGTWITVLWNDGGASFTKASKVPINSFGQAVTAGDLDGDGAVDLVVCGIRNGYVCVLRNSGGGAFAPAEDLLAGAEPRWVEAADLDGDGRPDLAVANWASSDVTLLFHQGQGNFGERRTVNLSPWWRPKFLSQGVK